MRTGEAEDGSNASDELEAEEQLAALLHDVEQLVRHGHVAQAALRASSLPAHGPNHLGPALDRLTSGGFGEEASIVDLAWRRPVLTDVLGRASLVGWIAAFVTFVAFFWQARLFAVVPAMGARFLVSEIYLQISGLQAIELLPTVERRRARTLFDLEIYSTRGGHRFGRVDAAMLTAGGIVLYSVAIWARTTATSGRFVWVMTVGGTIMAFAGGFAWAATMRLARSGINASKVLEELAPLPVVRPPFRVIGYPMAFARPRLGRSMLLPILLVLIGVPSVISASPGQAVVGAFCLVAAAALTYRAMGSELVVGPQGIVVRGVLTTRKWPWDEIHEVRIVTARDSDRTQSLRMITKDGSDRTLMANAGRHGVNPELLRLCDSMNGHSTAQSPGPTRRARARRVIGLVVMTFFVLVLGLFAADAMFGKGSASMAPAEVPAGRAYSYYQRADGSTSAASIECPSLASRMAGSGDPLCGESFTNSAIAVGVLLAIELALMTGMVLVAGSYRRLRRERRAARQVAVGASA